MTKVKGLNLCNATCGVGRRMAKTVAPEKVSRLDREFLENGSKKLTKLFTAIFFLFLLGVGNVWGLDASMVASSASTSISDGDYFIIATAKTSGNYLTTTVSSGWGICTTTLGDAAIYTAHGDEDSFYLTCSAGRLVPGTTNFAAYDKGTTANLQLDASGNIVNSSSTTKMLQYNSSGGGRWYANTQTAMYLFKVTLPARTVSYSAGNGTCKSSDTESSGGKGVTLAIPTLPSACTAQGWAFAGWKQTCAQTTTTTKPTLYAGGSTYYPADDETLYAVYKRSVSSSKTLPIGKVLFEETFEGFSADDVPETSNSYTIVYGGGSVTYTCSNGGGTTKIYTANLAAGGASPEIMVAKSNGSLAISGIPTRDATKLLLSYHTNRTTTALTRTVSSNASLGDVYADDTDTKLYYQPITITSGSSITLTFKMTTSENARLDDIKIVVGDITTYTSSCTFDYFVDIMHDNDEELKEGASYSMPAALSDADKGDTYCDELHYHFLGWVEDKYIKNDGTLDTEAVGFEMFPAGDAGHTANNKTFYAVWGKEE